MSFKTIILVVICLFPVFNYKVIAQRFNISWGDNSKLVGDYDDAVQLGNGNYIITKYEKPKVFTSYKDLTPDPTLMLVGPNMVPIKENKLEIEEKNDQYRKLRKYGNNLFLTYSAYENKYTSAYAIKINQQTLQPGIKITLGSFDSDSPDDQADITFKLSSDSSKILLFAEGPDRKKENKQFYIGVFDTAMKKIWSRYVELPIGDRFVSIYDQDITNEGKVFVAIKHYDKEVTRQTVREEGDKVPSYVYKLLVYSREGPPKQITFDLKNNFIEGTKLLYDKNGFVTTAGLYKKKYNGNIIGVFYTVFDSTASIVSSNQIIAFPKEIIDLVDKDGQGKSTGSDPGIYSYLRIKDILPRGNGTVDLISEIYMVYITIQMNRNALFYNMDRYHYIYGDIININLDKEGHAIFTRIPKRQEGYQLDWALGYCPVMYGDKLVLLYNDHEDNITRDLSKDPEHFYAAKKAVLAAATIDAKGNLTRQAVYNFRDEKRLALPRDFVRLSENKYLLVSVSVSFMTRRIGFGLLEIK